MATLSTSELRKKRKIAAKNKKLRKEKALNEAKAAATLPKYKGTTYLQEEERLKEALIALYDPEQTQIKSLRKAARVFNVTYSTLWGRKHATQDTLAKNGGHNRLLNEPQEAVLIWYIEKAIEANMPVTLDMLRSAAAAILRSVRRQDDEEEYDVNDYIGPEWPRRWVKRMNTDGRYKTISTTPIDHKRKDSLSPRTVMDYFYLLKSLLKRYNIDIRDIHNMDEVGFRIGCIRSQTVITHKNVGQVSKTKFPI